MTTLSWIQASAKVTTMPPFWKSVTVVFLISIELRPASSLTLGVVGAEADGLALLT